MQMMLHCISKNQLILLRRRLIPSYLAIEVRYNYQSPAREESTAITTTETSSHGGSVHPQIPTPETTELQEQNPAARPPSNQSPIKQRLTFQTQFSYPESLLEQSQDAQHVQGKSVEDDGPQFARSD